MDSNAITIVDSLNFPRLIITWVNEYIFLYGLESVWLCSNFPKHSALNPDLAFNKNSMNQGKNNKNAIFSMLPMIAVTAIAAPIM